MHDEADRSISDNLANATPVDECPGDEHRENRRQILALEAEHFFQGELAQDQRASWLLTLDIALFAGVIGLRSTQSIESASPVASWLLVFSAIMFFFAGIAAVIAIWPVAGKKAALWSPFRRPAKTDESLNDLNVDQWFEEHYNAHRLRASVKGRRVACTAGFLLVGVVTSAIGLFVASL